MTGRDLASSIVALNAFSSIFIIGAWPAAVYWQTSGCFERGTSADLGKGGAAFAGMFRFGRNGRFQDLLDGTPAESF